MASCKNTFNNETIKENLAKNSTAQHSISAIDAYKLSQENQVVILDVRTPEEFKFVGHPKDAINVPLMLFEHQYDVDNQCSKMILNKNFVAIVKKQFSKDTPFAILCRSGTRAQKARKLLIENNFSNVKTIEHGFQGDINSDPKSKFYGKRNVNGWINNDLPWTY